MDVDMATEDSPRVHWKYKEREGNALIAQVIIATAIIQDGEKIVDCIKRNVATNKKSLEPFVLLFLFTEFYILI